MIIKSQKTKKKCYGISVGWFQKEPMIVCYTAAAVLSCLDGIYMVIKYTDSEPLRIHSATVAKKIFVVKATKMRADNRLWMCGVDESHKKGGQLMNQQGLLFKKR